MKFKVVTAFDEKLFKQNGHKLLESFKSKWQPDFEFHCYYYNMDINNYSMPKESNIFYHKLEDVEEYSQFCLLYTSPSPRDGLLSRMPSSA